MRIHLADLWRWDGKVDRGPYFLLGTVLLAIKANLDWLVADRIFGRDWYLFHYVVLPHQAARIDSLDIHDLVFFVAMLLLALPFIWTGVALTLRRLRAVGLPAGLVVLFFLPLVNLLFFLILCLLSSGPEEVVPASPRLRRLREIHARIAPSRWPKPRRRSRSSVRTPATSRRRTRWSWR
jgi:uncharacterized membrane protein YhaH (DUF805 family)